MEAFQQLNKNKNNLQFPKKQDEELKEEGAPHINLKNMNLVQEGSIFDKVPNFKGPQPSQFKGTVLVQEEVEKEKNILGGDPNDYPVLNEYQNTPNFLMGPYSAIKQWDLTETWDFGATFTDKLSVSAQTGHWVLDSKDIFPAAPQFMQIMRFGPSVKMDDDSIYLANNRAGQCIGSDLLSVMGAVDTEKLGELKTEKFPDMAGVMNGVDFHTPKDFADGEIGETIYKAWKRCFVAGLGCMISRDHTFKVDDQLANTKEYAEYVNQCVVDWISGWIQFVAAFGKARCAPPNLLVAHANLFKKEEVRAGARMVKADKEILIEYRALSEKKVEDRTGKDVRTIKEIKAKALELEMVLLQNVTYLGKSKEEVMALKVKEHEELKKSFNQMPDTAVNLKWGDRLEMATNFYRQKGNNDVKCFLPSQETRDGMLTDAINILQNYPDNYRVMYGCCSLAASSGGKKVIQKLAEIMHIDDWPLEPKKTRLLGSYLISMSGNYLKTYKSGWSTYNINPHSYLTTDNNGKNGTAFLWEVYLAHKRGRKQGTDKNQTLADLKTEWTTQTDRIGCKNIAPFNNLESVTWANIDSIGAKIH